MAREQNGGGAEQRPLKPKDSLGDLRCTVSTCLTETFFFLKKLVAYFLKPFRLERIEIVQPKLRFYPVELIYQYTPVLAPPWTEGHNQKGSFVPQS